jgi:hypothetical protein
VKIAGEIFTVEERATLAARDYQRRTSAKPRKIEAFRDGYLAGFAAATRRGPELLNSLKRDLARDVAASIHAFKLKGSDDE